MEFEWRSAIVPNPIIFSPQTGITQVLEYVQGMPFQSNGSGCLVVDQGQVVGVLSPQGLLQVVGQYWREPERLERLTVADVMTPPLTITAAAASFETLRSCFQTPPYPEAIVVKAEGEGFGLITVASLFRHLHSTQPFALSDLEDECDQTQLFQATFEQAAVGIAHVSPTGKFLRVNQKFCQITGYDREEMMQLTFQEITYPDDLSIDLEYVYQLAAGTLKTYSMEKRYVRKNRSITWANLTVSAVYTPQKNIQYYISVVAEINDRKKLERDYKRELTSIYEAEQLLTLQARRAEVLLSLPAAADRLQEQDFLQHAQEQVESLTESQIAFIHFVNHDEQTIELVAWSHRTLQHFCTASFETHYPVNQAGIWADALRQRQPVVFNDYEQYPHKRGLPEGHAVLRRLISVPVMDNGKVVMLTGVGNKATNYTDLDLETVQLLSNEIWRLAQTKRTLSQLQNLNCELEQRVEERAARLHLATQAARLGIWDWDVVNDRLTWDDRMYEIYGRNPSLTAQETLATWESCLHPEDAEETKTLLYKTIEDQQDFRATFRILQPSGKVFWIEAYAMVQRDPEGHPLRMIGVNADVSDRKMAEEQLKQENTFCQQILDNMVEGLCVCQILPTFPAIRFSLWNPAMAEITGYSLAEINALNWSKILYTRPEIRHRVIHLMSIIRQGKNVISEEYQIQHKDGRERTIAISTSILPNDAQNPIILALLQDISDRKQAEVQLQHSKTKFQRLVDDIGDDFMVFSYSTQKQVITYVSSGIRSIFGLFRHNVIHKDWDEVIPWLPHSIVLQKEALKSFEQKSTEFQQLEMEFIHPNGENRIVQVSQHPIFNKSNELIAVEGVVGDITQQKRSEASLRQANEELARATRLKDEFLAAMSHELRTPLNAILGMSEVLLEEILGEINEKQRESLETIQRSGKHLLELISDILDLSKIEAGKLELYDQPTDLEQLCSSSMAFVKQQALNKQIHLKTTLPPQLSPVLLDERRMRQVLVNLLSNAVKFTPKGGSVHLKLSLLPRDNDPQRQTLRITVTDTGIGIAPADQRKLFQPFVQIDGSLNRQYSGTGLGLALVKRIVDLYEGSVGLQSEVQQGSCFWVEIPCQVDTSQPAPQMMAAEPATVAIVEPTRPPLILLAEDNEANIQTLQNYLGAKGYELITANNGQEAIDLARSLQPDLILMDIQMPVMDGLAAITHLRADPNFNKIPIIALTALAMPGDDDRCLSAGANAYVTKPVKLKQLITIMKGLLQPNGG